MYTNRLEIDYTVILQGIRKNYDSKRANVCTLPGTGHVPVAVIFPNSVVCHQRVPEDSF